MSCEGVTIGLPSLGPKILLEPNIKISASARADSESGTWTAIWSPSKSALNAGVTNGCKRMARPSTNLGIKAWMPKRCKVGARFKRTGWFSMTDSTTSHTRGSWRSMSFSALFGFEEMPRFTISLITKGLNNWIAISRGIPHWNIFKSGPTAITERPEKSTRLPKRFWRKRPCLPFKLCDKDFKARPPAPEIGLERRPLSIKASTASWSIRFSFCTMIAGVPISMSLRKRLLRVMTRR